LLVENDEVLLEGIVHPELSGDLGLEGAEGDLGLEDIADAEAFDGDVLLVDVGVHGGGAGDVGGHVLDVVIGGDDDRAVGLDDADVADVDLLVGCGLTPESARMRDRAVVWRVPVPSASMRIRVETFSMTRPSLEVSGGLGAVVGGAREGGLGAAAAGAGAAGAGAGFCCAAEESGPQRLTARASNAKPRWRNETKESIGGTNVRRIRWVTR
jgi:hypothetical protein